MAHLEGVRVRQPLQHGAGVQAGGGGVGRSVGRQSPTVRVGPEGDIGSTRAASPSASPPHRFRAGGPRNDQATVSSRNSAPAASSPTPAATAATSAAAAPAATHAAATATTATADPSHLRQASGALLPIEQMERGKTDVGHLFLPENEALPGPGQVIVRLRDIRRGQRRCECAPRQRKPKSSGTQRRRGSGFGRASPSWSLLHPCHGRFPRYVTGFKWTCGCTRTA
jgi:hypothetical protein